MPQTPNFKPGVGKLATDRYDFQSHLDGTNFRHKAGQIDLSPAITIGSATFTDVQSVIAELAGTVVVPTVPNATTTSTGVIQLAGDIGGTATSIKVLQINGTPLASFAGLTSGQVLQWNGSTWINAPFTSATGSQLGAIVLGGDLAGTGSSASAPRVSGLNGIPIDLTITPTNGQVLAYNSGTGKWGAASASGTPQATTSTQGTIQLAGDLGGSGTSATAPRVSGINGATVPAAGSLTTGNVLQVTGTSTLSYGLIADVNVSNTATIAGTKISPNFGSQAISTTGTASFGATTTGTLTAGISTSANLLTGSLAYTTRTISSSLVIDTTTTDSIIFVNASGGPVNITLPTPTNGRTIIIKDISGNASGQPNSGINVLQHSTEKIEGLATTKTLTTNWGSWTFVSNQTDWFMI